MSEKPSDASDFLVSSDSVALLTPLLLKQESGSKEKQEKKSQHCQTNTRILLLDHSVV